MLSLNVRRYSYALLNEDPVSDASLDMSDAPNCAPTDNSKGSNLLENVIMNR